MSEYSVSPAGEKFLIPSQQQYDAELQRIEELVNAARSSQIWYCGYDMFECYDEWNLGPLFPTYKYWDGTLNDIKSLRCDGLIEVCYEMNGMDVWGKIVSYNTHYDIRVDSFQAEHNDQNFALWKRYLAPATQCGNVEYGYEGVYWDSALSPQNLCEPVGNSGGWD